MATLQSTATGNFTDSTTWSVIDSASFLDTRAGTTATPTVATNGANFAPGAITVAGITLQFSTRVNSPSGTITVSLWNSTAGVAVAGTSVTINVADLPNTNNIAHRNWVYFKFAAPVTLLGGTNYAVRVVASTAAQSTIWTSVNNNSNWSRGLVTTTNAAPAATDVLIITGEQTGAGASNPFTVTMNNTAATAFGNIYVASGGSLLYGTAAATNYVLRMTGNLLLSSGGTVTMGTLATPIPNDSTAVMEFNVASNGQFGLYLSGGTLQTYGMVKTPYVKLGADAAAGATTITLNSTPTGWVTGDIIGLPSTTRTNTQTEVRTLSANVTTTSATVTAGLTNAHGGNSTTLVQGHVANLSRNVRIRSVSATLASSFQVYGFGCSVSMNYTQLLMIGSASDTLGAASIYNIVGTGNSSVSIDSCSLYQSTTVANSRGIFLGNTGLQTAFPSSYSITNNVVWGMGQRPINVESPGAGAAQSALSSRVLTGNLFVFSGEGRFTDMYTSTANNAFAAGTANGFIVRPVGEIPSGTTSFLSGLEVYGCGFAAYNIQGIEIFRQNAQYTLVFNNWTVWRNNQQSVVSSYPHQAFPMIKFVGMRAFGDNLGLLQVNTIFGTTAVFESCYFWGGTTLTSPYAIVQSSITAVDSANFIDCVFGRDHLGNTSNFSISILYTPGTFANNNIVLINPTCSGTLVSRLSTISGVGYSNGITILRLNGVAGSDFIYMNNGTLSKDTAIYKTASPSARVTPVGALIYAPTTTVRIPVKAGQTCTVSVWVRKSAAGDGAAYNGTQPQLYWRYNALAGNLTDTVVDTMTAAVGTWEQLTYTTAAMTYDTVLEFLVVCDGTTGWINVDEWSTNLSNTTNNDYILSSWVGQYVEPDFTASTGGAGGSFVFIS